MRATRAGARRHHFGASSLQGEVSPRKLAPVVSKLTEREALDPDQLQRHLGALDPTSESDRVIAITPDADQPSAIDALGHDRLSWISFRSLSEAIDQYLEDEGEIVGDRERYLLRELQASFKHDGLLDLPADVMVVVDDTDKGATPRLFALPAGPLDATSPRFSNRSGVSEREPARREGSEFDN